VLRAITDQIMYEIMALTGQTYVDEYVTRAKARMSRGHAQLEAVPDADAQPAQSSPDTDLDEREASSG